jgi:hypothetical protein
MPSAAVVPSHGLAMGTLRSSIVAAADCAATSDAAVGLELTTLQPTAQQQHQSAGLAESQPATGSASQGCPQTLQQLPHEQQQLLDSAQQAAVPDAGGPTVLPRQAAQPDTAEAAPIAGATVQLQVPSAAKSRTTALAPASAVSLAASPLELAAAAGLRHTPLAEQGSIADAATLAAIETADLQRPQKRRRHGRWAKVGRKWVLY